MSGPIEKGIDIGQIGVSEPPAGGTCIGAYLRGRHRPGNDRGHDRARKKPRERELERESSRAMVSSRPAPLAPRRMFGDVSEPLGTLLRLGVLGFGASGWLAMAGARFSLFLTIGILAVLAFPARKKVRGVGKELDAMLSEGQGGFTDLMRGAMSRR